MKSFRKRKKKGERGLLIRAGANRKENSQGDLREEKGLWGKEEGGYSFPHQERGEAEANPGVLGKKRAQVTDRCAEWERGGGREEKTVEIEGVEKKKDRGGNLEKRGERKFVPLHCPWRGGGEESLVRTLAIGKKRRTGKNFPFLEKREEEKKRERNRSRSRCQGTKKTNPKREPPSADRTPEKKEGGGGG